MQYGIQITATIVMLIIIISFMRNRKLPLLSIFCFWMMIVFSLMYTIADFVAVYSLYNLNNNNINVLNIAYRLVLVSLMLIGYSWFCYIECKRENRKDNGFKGAFLTGIPLWIGIGVCIFGNITFIEDARGNYPVGLMIWTSYIAMAIYLFAVVLILFMYKKNYHKDARVILLVGTGVAAAVGAVELFFPYYQISAISIVILMLSIFISMENPREYKDTEISNALNVVAFEQLLNELFNAKKDFYIVTTIIKEASFLHNIEGMRELKHFLEVGSYRYSKYTNHLTFHSRTNAVSVIVYNDEELEALGNVKEEGMSYESSSEGFAYPNYFAAVIHCPEYATSFEEVINILDYLYTVPIEEVPEDKVLHVDKDILDQMTYLNKVEELLSVAVKNDGFEVYLQPIYDVATERFRTAEALVRLKDTDTIGYVSPEVFIPIAEKKGYIRDVGNIVFEHVCSFAESQKLWEKNIDFIEVNLSRMQGVDPKFPETLNECMVRHNIPAEFINLEITETANAQIGDLITDNVDTLHKMGCGFSMDDFGTGYSNLSKMTESHFEIIKLDKTLLWPCFAHKGAANARIILKNCVNMIHELGLIIVAEGVETKEQFEFLKDFGVECLQGYYFSRPLPETEFVKFIDKKNK